MAIHTTDAIVLRRYPFRETSVVVTCLSDRFGKLKGLVKGLRAHPNRHRSAMEPMSVNRIVFYDTRSSQLHLISQCELLAPMAGLQRDLETMRTAAFCTDLVDHVVPLEELQPATYQLFKQTLERLALGAGNRQELEAHFIVRLLRLAGFQPQLNECTGCGTTLHVAGYWSARQGGLLCQRCLHQDPQAEMAPSETLAALTALSDAQQPPGLEPKLLAALRTRLQEFLHWRLDRPLRMLKAQGSRLKADPPASSLQPSA